MVEARRRLRLERAARPLEASSPPSHRPHRRAAKWTLDLRDGEHGDRLRLALHRTPWPNTWLADGQLLSSAAIAERLRILLTHAA